MGSVLPDPGFSDACEARHTSLTSSGRHHSAIWNPPAGHRRVVTSDGQEDRRGTHRASRGAAACEREASSRNSRGSRALTGVGLGPAGGAQRLGRRRLGAEAAGSSEFGSEATVALIPFIAAEASASRTYPSTLIPRVRLLRCKRRASSSVSSSSTVSYSLVVSDCEGVGAPTQSSACDTLARLASGPEWLQSTPSCSAGGVAC